MKALSLFVAIAMMIIMPSTMVHAQTVTLQSAIQQLNFSLTVEWDQKDPNFKAKALKTFNAQIKELQASGVSTQSIVAGLKSQLKDAKLIADLDRLANVAKTKKMSPKQTQSLVAQYAAQAQKAGASWTGEGAVYTLVAIAVIALIVVAIANGNVGVVVSDPYPYCYDDCYTDCYYDYWGDYVCNRYCDRVCY
jgi:hypothetical protein